MPKRIELELTRIGLSPIYQYVLLAVLTLLAAILRFYKLGEWSYWFDEVFTLNRVLNNYDTFEAVVHTSLSHKFLPLSVILSGGALNLFGTSEWSARLVPAIMGIISVPVLYFPTSKIFGWRVGMIAALLLTISTWHIYWSQNARFFTSLLFFYTLALFAFYFAIERDRPLYIFIGYLLLYLAFSERFIAMWFVPVIACYLIVLKITPIEKPAGFRPRNVALIIALPLIGIAAIEILSLLTAGSARFLTESFLSDFEFFLLNRNDDPLRLFYLIAFNISFPVMCFAFFSGIYLIVKKNRAGLFFFISALIPVILILLLNLFVFTKDRYVFLTLFSWLILAAVAISELFAHTKDRTKLLAVAVLILLVADAASSALLYYGVNNGNRRDWEGTFALIEEQANDGDIFVSFWPQLANYYLGEEGLEWQNITPKSVMNSSNRFWFVVDSETVWANDKMNTWLNDNADLIEVKYLRTPEDLYLRTYLYDPEKQRNE